MKGHNIRFAGNLILSTTWKFYCNDIVLCLGCRIRV